MLKKMSYIIGILGLFVFAAGCNQGAMPDNGNDLQRTTLGPNQNQRNYQEAETREPYFERTNGTSNRRNVIYRKNERILNEPIPTPQEAKTGNRFGLVHVTRSDLDQLNGAPFKINQNALANIVAQSISSLPDVENATILVTDDHIYIGYNNGTAAATNQTNRAEITKKIKQAADSVVPGYYRVHVSSDRNLTDKIISLTNGTTGDIDRELDGILDATRNRPLTPGSNSAGWNQGTR